MTISPQAIELFIRYFVAAVLFVTAVAAVPLGIAFVIRGLTKQRR